jgi:DNA processing protein
VPGGGGEVLPDEAYAAALLGLPGLWPARLAALLGQRRARPGDLLDTGDPVGPQRAPRQAWAQVRAGRAADHPDLVARIGSRTVAEALGAHWAAAADRTDVGRSWAAYRRLGVTVDLLGTPSYPPELARDKGAPYVLLRQGTVPSLGGRRVAIVGTRRCSPSGREIAAEFGEALAGAGVRVVSGLALGIDGGAHQGALAARGGAPIGVVAGGFDVPYPARHRTLWRQVAEQGVLVSEWPLGTRSEGWRFPARNRVIAALAEAVIVVESGDGGGSMITADEALGRGVEVMAVPGSIRNPAAAGTNRLIRDGATPVCGPEDVLTALSLQAGPDRWLPTRPPPPASAGPVLAAVGWEPTPMSLLMTRTGLDPAALAVELAHLELDGWVTGGGGWWQRLAGDGR